ncbi:hypothetical protein CDAR_197561 [Caerostris darwini]|uniref:Uncharacterized protein n=1 Tax=Caerostris darwini TaxID=1538125 RepID=A0AAV4T5Q7_9ARAC|nr:hypothetical protein CDAR_197561 [Caerostris darwini]
MVISFTLAIWLDCNYSSIFSKSRAELTRKNEFHFYQKMRTDENENDGHHLWRAIASLANWPLRLVTPSKSAASQQNKTTSNANPSPITSTL